MAGISVAGISVAGTAVAGTSVAGISVAGTSVAGETAVAGFFAPQAASKVQIIVRTMIFKKSLRKTL
ncbi:MAG: hypothetical protein EHM40_03040 [Chloroflexi bacterium]|nr:MAG: hypothetical protein EHM40_03040 [Chloroflexota bacterium]